MSVLSLREVRRFAAHVLPASVLAAAVSGQVVVLPSALPSETSVTPAESAATAKASTWVHGATVRLVLGYTDNVLWSAASSEGRGFAQAEIESFLWRPARAGWEAKALLSGEVRRYGSALPEASGEQRWIGRGEFAVLPHAWLRIALIPQAFYTDQVYDLSPDVGRRFVAKMRVKGVSGTAQARLTLPGGWEIEPAVQEREMDYLDFSEDFSETKTGVRLRWRKGALEVGAAIYDHLRSYRDRVNNTAGGRALTGSKLRFHQTTAEANVGWAWQWRGQWRLSPAYLHVENRDRASGFFNYDQRRLRLDLAWEGARWRVEAEASAARYDYLAQTVGMGIAPPARVREDFVAGVSVEHTLTSRWKMVTRYVWERSRTNEFNASYRINTVSSGVAWNY